MQTTLAPGASAGERAYVESLIISSIALRLRSGEKHASLRSHRPDAFREREDKGVLMPKPSSKKSDKPVEELTYEEALAELESIVSALEEDASRNPLDDAIKLFERGQALASRCGVLLEAAELKVKQVAGDAVIPFEEESE